MFILRSVLWGGRSMTDILLLCFSTQVPFYCTLQSVWDYFHVEK